MDRSTIESMIAFIPLSEMGTKQSDEEIWEADDQGVDTIMWVVAPPADV